ncbi:glycerol-3-phosphate dehydrogenase C-terminal domain-containing protein, partial [Streptomyces sp. SAS_269]|uniref:glycerol-3-phosphate dehydrogenase C-terminal domain-containing protein n=1 Tax=Streptomyces sp. SAS_269 TaxID=3412749 RepID=UPI00403CF931
GLPGGPGGGRPGRSPVRPRGRAPAGPRRTTDIGFLLDVLGSVLDVPVRRDEVVGAFAGLRPLLDTGGAGDAGDAPARTSDISRRHAVLTSADGVTTVVGGKLTTYRRMAQDAVDAALEARGLPVRPSPTMDLPLVGAAPPGLLRALPAPRRLVRRHGTEAPAVQALAERDPALAEPVLPGHPVTRAELVWAALHEGALEASDLLDRCTRIGLVPEDRAEAFTTARDALERAAAGQR